MPSPLDMLKVVISNDKTKATITLPAPREDSEARLDYAELVAKLSGEHKLTGLKEDVLAALVDAYNENQEGCEDTEVATSSKPMVPGRDTAIEWKIAADPTLEEDAHGRVDFYSASALPNVTEGELLAVLHPAQQGTPGVSVTGETVLPTPAKDTPFAAGENVEFRAGTGEFYALRGGRVEMRGPLVVVSKALNIDTDVDFSVGNVKFEGFVHVRGTVQDNFKIEATDGIQVDKIVEAASLESGGSITVMGGVNCRGKGVLSCKGDLVTRFLNNAEIKCHGTVKVEREVLNCKVTADRLEAKAGAVSGGDIIAASSIEVKEAGSPMGVKTVLHVGKNPFMEVEIEALEKNKKAAEDRIEELTERLDLIAPVADKLSAPVKKGVGAMTVRRDHLKTGLAQLETKLDNLKQKAQNTDGTVIIHDAIHPGVVIRIGRYEKTMSKTFEGYRRFTFDKHKLEVVASFQ